MRVLAYGKRLGVLLAGVLLGTSLGLSSVASGVVVGTRGVANPGFNANGRGLNRAGPTFPTIIRPAPLGGQLPPQAILPVTPVPVTPVTPVASPPIINPPVVNPF